MNHALGKLLGLHQAYWKYDTWYRPAWLVGPPAASMTALVLLLLPGSPSAPAAPWVKPQPAAQQPSADQQLCQNSTADTKLRGEACDRLISRGQLTRVDLASAYFGRGWARHNASQIEPAIADYSEAIKHNPNSYVAYSNRGALYLHRNDPANALRDYTESIRLAPTFANALAGRAEVLRRQGKLSEALTDANKAVESNKTLAYAQTVRDAILADIKRLESNRTPPAPQPSADQQLCQNAAADIKLRGEVCGRLISQGQLTGVDLARAYFGRGWARHNAGQIEPAIADYSEAIKHDPRNHVYYNNRGVLYLQRNDFADALRDYNESIRIAPTYANAFAGRAEVLHRQGKLADALTDANKAVEFNKTLAYAQTVRDAILADIKRLESNRTPPAPQPSADQQLCQNAAADTKLRGEACDRLISQGQLTGADLASAYFGRGRTREKTGESEQAIADYTEAIRLNPRHHIAYYNRGANYLREKNDLANAMRDFSSAIGIAGHGWEPHYGRATVHRMRGEIDAALKDLNAAIGEHNGRDARLHLLRGRVHLQMSARTMAREDFNKAVELAPDNAEAYYLRASAEIDETFETVEFCRSRRAGQSETGGGLVSGPCSRPVSFDGALKDLNTALAKRPDYALAHFHIGRIMRQENRIDEAIQSYSAAIRIAPRFSMAYNNRGGIYFRQKRYDLALADFDEAIRLDENNKFAWASRGELHATRGQRRRAISDLRKALAIDENYAYARQELDRIQGRRR